jgi:hypothetical protein
MKPVVSILALHWTLSVNCLLATAQASSDTAEIEQLKLIVGQQQRALEQQQAQILVLQSALAEQKKILVDVVQGPTSGAALAGAMDRKDNDPQAQRTYAGYWMALPLTELAVISVAWLPT